MASRPCLHPTSHLDPWLQTARKDHFGRTPRNPPESSRLPAWRCLLMTPPLMLNGVMRTQLFSARGHWRPGFGPAEAGHYVLRDSSPFPASPPAVMWLRDSCPFATSDASCDVPGALLSSQRASNVCERVGWEVGTISATGC
jgi:hypothetical protein